MLLQPTASEGRRTTRKCNYALGKGPSLDTVTDDQTGRQAGQLRAGPSHASNRVHVERIREKVLPPLLVDSGFGEPGPQAPGIAYCPGGLVSDVGRVSEPVRDGFGKSSYVILFPAVIFLPLA